MLKSLYALPPDTLPRNSRLFSRSVYVVTGLVQKDSGFFSAGNQNQLMPKAYTALPIEFQMSRLLNCCGRRKKTLLDLKESMLGPFMLLALRGDSSFIQVSAISCRALSPLLPGS